MKIGLVRFAVLALCAASQAYGSGGKPRLPWWATLKSQSTRGLTSSTTEYPRNNEIMYGDMDKMHPNAELLTEPPPNFSMLPTSNRIINGHDAFIADYPYQLQLAIYGSQSCGASIISRQWAATAAHCMFDNRGHRVPLNALTLRAGASVRNKAGSLHMVDTRVIPGPYTDKDHDYDIALLKVVEPFVFNKKVRPIALPSQGQRLLDGEVGVLSGWGHTKSGGFSSDILQYVVVPLVNQRKCERVYNTPTRRITERMLCAGAPNRDSCQGDSGGPLAVNGRLVGIVSFGIGCALDGYPGVNTRVSEFRSFIKKYTGV